MAANYNAAGPIERMDSSGASGPAVLAQEGRLVRGACVFVMQGDGNLVVRRLHSRTQR